MELKPGYKETEIGIIPADWNVDYIENIGHVTTGSKNTQDRIEDGDYPFFVRSQTVERINTYSFDGEAVLTAGDGVGTGKVFHYINGKFDVHQRVYRISDFSPRVNGHFFFLYFSRSFYNRIMQMTAKSSVDSVRRDMITRMIVPLPTIEGEQDAISQAIRDVDALLDGLDRLIAKKRDLKQAAMQQLLTGETRLPGFEGEWEVKRLGDGCAVITKGTTPTSVGKHFKESGVTFLKVEALSDNGRFIADQFAFIDRETHQLLKRSQLQSGDLLISIAGALGRTGIVPGSVLPANTNQALAIVRLLKESEFDERFLYYSVKAEQTQRHFSAISVQGAQANLSLQQISDIPIWCPRKEEQTAIATVLSDMDAEIAALEQRRNKTKDIKQAMMQELLTGKTRLVTPGGSNA